MEDKKKKIMIKVYKIFIKTKGEKIITFSVIIKMRVKKTNVMLSHKRVAR